MTPLLLLQRERAQRGSGERVVAPVVGADAPAEVPVGARGAEVLDPAVFIRRDGLLGQLAADPCRFFRHHDAEAVARQGERRRAPADTTADDDGVHAHPAGGGSPGDHSGKAGQSLLFAALDLPRPRTIIFPSVRDFKHRRGGALARPFVLKTNLGGQGRGVYLVTSQAEQRKVLKILGQGPFIQQELIDHGGRDLRVVLIGGQAIAYWRWAPPGEAFLTNVSKGGLVDFESDPDLIRLGVQAVRDFAAETGVNLAAFDLMFDRNASKVQPLFIEINYYFGRTALGGSMDYYRLLRQAAARWLKDHGLKRGRVRSRPKYSQRD